MENDRGRGKNKQFWTEEELKALIAALQALALDTYWKTDTGFRSNYMQEVHKRIVQKMPNFSKQVEPHIESKIKWLKGKYNAISEMLRESGCSWNEDEQKIKCEREWFEAWVLRHKEAKGTWDLKFPHLDALELVYGRDRATGQTAEGFDDAVNDMEPEAGEFTGMREEQHDNLNDGFSNAESSWRKQKRPLKMEPKRMKKSAGTSIEDTFGNVGTKLEKCIDGISGHFGTIAGSLAEDIAFTKASFGHKSSIMVELQKLGLTSGDVFKAGNIIGAEESKLHNFFQLSDEMRRQYVYSLLYPNGF